MNYLIKKNGEEPAYIQLYNYLVQDIVSGIYPLGSKLPSKRIIAEETGVSLITVEHALNLLIDEGYVETRQRSGYFVIYRDVDFQVVPEFYAGNHSKNCSAEDSQSKKMQLQSEKFPFSVLARTMRKVLLDYGEQILVKSPNHGCEELRAAICAYLGRSRGIQIQSRQVIIGSGAEYLYGLVAQLFGAGCVFGIENPSYEKIQRVYEAMGIVCDPLTLSEDGISTAELTRTQASVLHVTPFHSYPTGITIGISRKREYLYWAKQRNAVIVEDNYDSELTVSSKPESPLFSIAEDVRVIYMNTFSKTIAPSVRIGYMVLPETLVDVFEQKLGFYSCPVPLFEQYVLAELLQSGDYERHINRIRRKRRRESSLLFTHNSFQ